jgi:hypothetical protein
MRINLYLGKAQLRMISQSFHFLEDLADLHPAKDGYYHLQASQQAFKAMVKDKEILNVFHTGEETEVAIYGLRIFLEPAPKE